MFQISEFGRIFFKEGYDISSIQSKFQDHTGKTFLQMVVIMYIVAITLSKQNFCLKCRKIRLLTSY